MKKGMVSGLAGIVLGSAVLGGCSDVQSFSGVRSHDYNNNYSVPKETKIKYSLIMEKQPDGNYVCEVPRNPDLQMRLKKTIMETVPAQELKFREDGTLADIRYIIKFPNGSAQFVPYQDE